MTVSEPVIPPAGVEAAGPVDGEAHGVGGAGQVVSAASAGCTCPYGTGFGAAPLHYATFKGCALNRGAASVTVEVPRTLLPLIRDHCRDGGMSCCQTIIDWLNTVEAQR